MKGKKIAVIATSLATVGVLLAGSGVVSAANQPGTTLVDTIAQRFNLDKSQVQTVVDNFRTERQVDREQKYQQRLQKAVDQHTITASQKDLILAKHKEIQDFLKTLKGKTPAERRQALKTERDQVRTWADDNHIPIRFLLPIAGLGRGL